MAMLGLGSQPTVIEQPCPQELVLASPCQSGETLHCWPGVHEDGSPMTSCTKPALVAFLQSNRDVLIMLAAAGGLLLLLFMKGKG